MKIISGKVSGGKIELPPGVFADGESVAVVGRESDEPISLDPDQERELAEAIEAVGRGEFVDGDELIRSLKARHTG